MTVAMMDMTQKNSRTTVASSQNITINHAAEAAVEAGFQAFFDTLAAGGSEADAIAAADAACQAIDASC